MYLVLSEISKKQQYIFRSNRIKENVGASFIVKYITEDLPKELLSEEDGSEIFRGGGKSLFLIKDGKEDSFIKKYSKKVIKDYSGVELFIVKLSFDMDKDNIINKIDEIYKDLARKKSEKKYNSYQLSFGIEEVCASTGLSAVDYKDGKYISKEISDKLKAFDEYKSKGYFKSIIGKDTHYSDEIDDLVKDDTKSYIAVIHIDGNNMGKKFQDLKDYHKGLSTTSNKLYIESLRRMSKEISDIYESCFKKLSSELKNEKGEIPLRPLILAGDDITFICNGKIAIKAARVFIENLNKEHITIGNKQVFLNACAGIALIKSSYPFSQGYKLAEELCESGKTYIKNNMKEDCSALDWHIVQGELEGSLNFLRKKYYSLNSIELTMKPYILDDKKWNSLNTFKTTLDIVRDKNIPRSKIKELRSIYRQGKDKTKMYMEMNGLERAGRLENKLDYIDNFRCEFGFNDDYAVFNDAIEIMDFIEEV